MAAVTHRVATPSTANATSYASGSFTPAVGDLLVVGVVAAGTTTPFPTMTNSAGTTFRFIGVSLLTASVDRLYLFVARTLVTSATPQTVTFDCTGDAATGATILVGSVSGMTRTADTGAVRQYKVASNVAAGTPAVTFDNAVLTGNPTLGFVGNATNPAGLTAPTSWTEPAGGDTGFITPASGAEYVYRDSGFTGTTITWGSASASAYGAIVVELNTSSAPTWQIPLVGTPTINASATARTSTVLTSPSGSQADDVAVIQIQHSTGSADGTQTAPDGTWTLIDTQRGSGLTAWCFVYAKRLTGAAAATYTFTHPSTVSTGAMFILRGVDTTTMLDRTVQAGDLVSDTVAPYDVPVITTATDKALAVAVFSGAATASGFITAWPIDYEEIILYSDALTTDKMAIYAKEISPAGNTPSVRFALISDKDMVIGQFAFKPGTGGISGTLAATLEGTTLSATGKLDVAGALAQTLAGTTLVATGKLDVAGALAQTLAGTTVAAAGKLDIAGALAVALAGTTLVATGTLTEPPISGTLAATLEGTTLSATGKLDIAGALGVTLAGSTLAAAGTLATSGNLAQTLEGSTLSAQGKVDIAGVLAATLEGTSLAATGTLGIAGGLAQTLEGSTLTATGTLLITGNVAQTLEGTALDAIAFIGDPPNTGALAVTLEGTTLSAQGVLPITGLVDKTLEGTALSATGVLPIVGAVDVALEGTTLSAQGVLPITAALSVALEGTALSAAGVLPIAGALDVLLAGTSLLATGIGTEFAPPEFGFATGSVRPTGGSTTSVRLVEGSAATVRQLGNSTPRER